MLTLVAAIPEDAVWETRLSHGHRSFSHRNTGFTPGRVYRLISSWRFVDALLCIGDDEDKYPSSLVAMCCGAGTSLYSSQHVVRVGA